MSQTIKINMNGIQMDSGDPDRAQRTKEAIESGRVKSLHPRCDVAQHTHREVQNVLPLAFGHALEAEGCLPAALYNNLYLPFETIGGNESFGEDGVFGIRVQVGGTNMPDLQHDLIQNAVYDAMRKIKTAVREVRKAADPKTSEEAKARRASLLRCFAEQPIYVEEIPNGYCSDWCCKHLPWFIVTTSVGRFKIGWRKLVIHLDWEGSRVMTTAERLFPDDDVTKDGRMIHAYGYEKAKQYIAAVIAAGTQPQVTLTAQSV